MQPCTRFIANLPARNADCRAGMRKEPQTDEVNLSATAETSQERIGKMFRKGLRRHMGMKTCPAWVSLELARKA